jgi:hypothetical protein
VTCLTNTALLQDLNAIILAFEGDDYENTNIFANRLMSDAAILGDRKHLLIGFFSKDVAAEMMELTATKKATALATAKAHATMFLSKMNDHAKKQAFDEEGIWNEYVILSDRLRKFHLTPHEEKAYSDDKKFTHEVATWLRQYLMEKQNLLFERKSRLLKGVLNELGRVYRVFGAEKPEVIFLSLVTALDRVCDYVRFAYRSPDGSIGSEVAKSEILPYPARISALMQGQPIDVAAVDLLLSELIVKWREAFINYLEVPHVVRVPVEKGVQLPEETKKRIAEAVTKALEVKQKAKK